MSLPSPSTSNSQTSTPPSKRSRIVTSQSKKGCVTCKARRVKCDERKPLCWRCVHAGRLCGGYNHEAASAVAPRQRSGLIFLRPALNDGVVTTRHAERLCHLAAHVLSLDRNGQPLQGDSVWGRPFLQLSHTVDCVKAAGAAFGAAYESLLNSSGVISRNNPSSSSAIWYHYGTALQQLKSGLDNQTAGAESMALASLLLACVEILGQHEQNALAHFLGASRILAMTEEEEQQQQPHNGARASDFLEPIKQELFKVDVLIAGYTMSQTPAFMQLDTQEEATLAGDAFCEPESATRASILFLHRAYRFIGTAAPHRYKYPAHVDADPVMRRGRANAVAELQSVLDGLAALTTSLQAHLSELYALRSQATTALVFILCIHSPWETAYDEHQGLFRSIVSDAAAAARLRRRFKSGAFGRFSSRPGIVGPLSIVSFKCRDPPLRRLATTMLGEQGREGPADGPTLAAIGARLIALEEESALVSAESNGATTPLLNACDIHEGQRIHGYALAGSAPSLNEHGRHGVIQVEFSIPNPPLLQGWQQVEYSSQNSWIYRPESINI